jgi:hypothetical protein
VGTLIQDILMHLIGRIYLFLRFGRNSKDVVDKEYSGSYSSAARIILGQTFGVILMILIGCLFLSGIIVAVKSFLK